MPAPWAFTMLPFWSYQELPDIIQRAFEILPVETVTGFGNFNQSGILVQFHGTTRILYWNYCVGIAMDNQDRSVICFNSLIGIHVTNLREETPPDGYSPDSCSIRDV
jgi:hypothetical protein